MKTKQTPAASKQQQHGKISNFIVHTDNEMSWKHHKYYVRTKQKQKEREKMKIRAYTGCVSIDSRSIEWQQNTKSSMQIEMALLLRARFSVQRSHILFGCWTWAHGWISYFHCFVYPIAASKPTERMHVYGVHKSFVIVTSIRQQRGQLYSTIADRVLRKIALQFGQENNLETRSQMMT